MIQSVISSENVISRSFRFRRTSDVLFTIPASTRILGSYLVEVTRVSLNSLGGIKSDKATIGYPTITL